MADRKGQKINDLIFKELIKRGYSLEGNTRIWNIADSKLWYLTSEQAQAFLDLEDEEEYKKRVTQQELDLIDDNMEEFTEEIGEDNLNIIDLGCGNGKKAVIFIDYLKKKCKIRYCPIDISSYMVNKAIERIRKGDIAEVVEFQWNISDFENIENISILLRQGSFKRNLILLLGNTLGNFEINELLYEIRSSMKGGDFLLVGNGLDIRNPEEILKAYNSAHQDSMLIKTLTQIGLEESNLEYGTRFRNSRVEAYYTLKSDCDVNFLSRSVHFNKGDQIVVAVSYKYDKKDFISFLNLYFDEVVPKISEDGSYILALCKK